MDKKNIIIIAVVAVVIGAVAFFGGMKYSEAKASQNALAQRQQRMGAGFGGQGATGGQRAGARAGSGFVNGEIIAKDDKSLTIKMRDVGSKIVFLAGSTEVSKFAKGELSDLENGKNVMINGTANPDGSVVAQTIQIRPADTMVPPSPTSTR